MRRILRGPYPAMAINLLQVGVVAYILAYNVRLNYAWYDYVKVLLPPYTSFNFLFWSAVYLPVLNVGTLLFWRRRRWLSIAGGVFNLAAIPGVLWIPVANGEINGILHDIFGLCLLSLFLFSPLMAITRAAVILFGGTVSETDPKHE